MSAEWRVVKKRFRRCGGEWLESSAFISHWSTEIEIAPSNVPGRKPKPCPMS